MDPWLTLHNTEKIINLGWHSQPVANSIGGSMVDASHLFTAYPISLAYPDTVIQPS